MIYYAILLIEMGEHIVRVEYTKQAIKTLDAMQPKLRTHIMDSIASMPRGDIVPLQGDYAGHYRLRVGTYRVSFIYLDNTREAVVVHKIGPRGDHYK